MEIFDKSKLGYEDNESMLIGGFEQKEAVVGTEITFTQDDSVRTPRTFSGHSTQDLLFSSTDINLPSHATRSSGSSREGKEKTIPEE